MDKYIKIFKETGALLEGHFVLTSGRHSATYFQCAKVLQHPQHLSNFAATIVDHFKNTHIDDPLKYLFYILLESYPDISLKYEYWTCERFYGYFKYWWLGRNSKV